MDISEVDEKDEYLVYGFVRNIQSQLPNSSIFYIIPEVVYYQCIFFFTTFVEYFTSYNGNIELKQDSNDRIINCTQSGGSTAYGNICIDNKSPCVYVWKFKIIGEIAKGIFIGVNSDKTYKHFVRGRFNSWIRSAPYFAYCNDGFRYCVTKTEGARAVSGVKFELNDIIRMEVNIYNKTIKYYVNDKRALTYGFQIDNDVKCYMAVALDKKNSSVKLLHFHKFYRK